MTYYHNNLFGNVVAASDENGQLLWRKAYQPFGQLIEDGSTKTTDTQGFVGKRFDTETGLLDFGARVYSPLLGRFLSIDPAEVQGDNPFSFNRYIYANDNPYKYKDPDGREAVNIYNDYSLFDNLSNNLRVHTWMDISRDDGSERFTFSFGPEASPLHSKGHWDNPISDASHVSSQRADQIISLKITPKQYDSILNEGNRLMSKNQTPNYMLTPFGNTYNCTTMTDHLLRSGNINVLNGSRSPGTAGVELNHYMNKSASESSYSLGGNSFMGKDNYSFGG